MSNILVVGGRTFFVASYGEAPVTVPTLIVEDQDAVALYQTEVLFKLRKVQEALKKVEDVIVHEQTVAALESAVVIYEPSGRHRIRQSIRSNAAVVDLGTVLDDLLAKLE